MSDHVYRSIEVTGSATDTIEDAIKTAISRSGDTLHNLRWFQVTDIRGHITADDIDHYQVTLKLGFTVDEAR